MFKETSLAAQRYRIKRKIDKHELATNLQKGFEIGATLVDKDKLKTVTDLAQAGSNILETISVSLFWLVFQEPVKKRKCCGASDVSNAADGELCQMHHAAASDATSYMHRVHLAVSTSAWYIMQWMHQTHLHQCNEYHMHCFCRSKVAIMKYCRCLLHHTAFAGDACIRGYSEQALTCIIQQ